MENSTQNKWQTKFGFTGLILCFCLVELNITTFNPSFRTGIPGISELNIVIFLLFLLAANQIVIKREKICLRPHDAFIMVYCFYCFLSLLYSCYLHGFSYTGEFLALKTYFNPFIIYFLLKNAISSVRQTQVLAGIIMAILVAGAIFSIVAFLLWPESYSFSGTRIEGIVGQANLYGMSIICLAPILLYYYKPIKNSMKVIRIGSIAILLVALFQTGSRGAMLGLAAICFLIFLKSKKKIKIIFVSAAIVPFIMVALYLSPAEKDTTMERFKIEDKGGLQKYSSGRLGLWQKVLQDSSERPILGYGFNSHAKIFYDPSGLLGTSPHNEYLYILYNMGLVGLLLYIGYLYKIWRFFKKRYTMMLPTACYLGLTGFLIHTMFSQPHGVRYLIWIFIGIASKYVDLIERNGLSQEEG